MEIGDNVLYIYNIPFQGRKNLNGARGIIVDIDTTYMLPGGSVGYCVCTWKPKKGESFEWAVPLRDVRLLKSSDLS
jgi:heat shock protein HspQ